MNHQAHSQGLRDAVLKMLLDRMGNSFCPSCAAQALINALSRVMSSTIRQADPRFAAVMAEEVAGHLETIAAKLRRMEAPDPEQAQERPH